MPKINFFVSQQNLTRNASYFDFILIQNTELYAAPDPNHTNPISFTCTAGEFSKLQGDTSIFPS